MVKLAQALAHVRAGRWEDAHQIAQSDDSPRGAWLHCILHIQEGDLPNAQYWYRRAGRSFPGGDALDDELARFEAELTAAG